MLMWDCLECLRNKEEAEAAMEGGTDQAGSPRQGRGLGFTLCEVGAYGGSLRPLRVCGR